MVFHLNPWLQLLTVMKHVSAVLVTLCVAMKSSSWRATLTESDDASQEKFYVFCLGRMIDFGIDPFSEKQKTGVEYIFKCASIMFWTQISWEGKSIMHLEVAKNYALVEQIQ